LLLLFAERVFVIAGDTVSELSRTCFWLNGTDLRHYQPEDESGDIRHKLQFKENRDITFSPVRRDLPKALNLQALQNLLRDAIWYKSCIKVVQKLYESCTKVV